MTRVRNLFFLALFAGIALLTVAPALAVTTSPTGGGAPFDVVQPSLAMKYVINVAGEGEDLGEVGVYAGLHGSLEAAGWLPAEGQSLQIAEYQTLFSLIGTTFGGDGLQTFSLPDLRGRTPIGAGQGPGLPNYALGQSVGAETATLATTPAHSHPIDGPLSTEPTGGDASYSNLQPSLALTPIISDTGRFPSRNSFALATAGGPGVAEINAGGIFDEPYYAEVTWIAHDTVPDGWFVADGSVLPIQNHNALFSLLGTQYGGDGETTFALPDLRGRAVIGAGNAPGLTNRQIGQPAGSETETVGAAEMAPHDHALAIPPGSTGQAGGGAPLNNLQPSLPLTHLISLQGIYPPASSIALATDGEAAPPIAELGSGFDPYLGTLTMFAGNFDPRGYASADGQLLPIASNSALFSLLWDAYGGDVMGQGTFNLPDLRGRVAVGVGQG